MLKAGLKAIGSISKATKTKGAAKRRVMRKPNIHLN
jgi:hypothetical protein